MVAVAAATLLGGCAASVDVPYASDAFVESKSYRHSGPPAITVITMVNNRTGSGGHSALMISGSERIIFDPAGSFKHEIVPEQQDVLFGITPAVLQGYKSAHARSTFHVVSQKIEVTAAQAELALRLAKSNGAVPSAFCTQATTGLLRQVPGFEDVKQTFFPTNLMEQIAKRPDVVTDRYYEDDDGGIVEGVARVQL
jgi:hypothetical protein